MPSNILVCILKSTARRPGQVSLACLGSSETPLESCTQVSAPSSKRDKDMLVQAQPRAAKMLKGWKHLTKEQSLRKPGLISLEKKRFGAISVCLNNSTTGKGDQNKAFQIPLEKYFFDCVIK